MSFFGRAMTDSGDGHTGAARAATLARTIITDHAQRIDCALRVHAAMVSAIQTVYEMLRLFSKTAKDAIHNHHALTCNGCSNAEAEAVAKQLVELQDELLFRANQLFSGSQVSASAWNANILFLRNHPRKGISIERVEALVSEASNLVFLMIAEVYTFYPDVQKITHIDSQYALHLEEAVRLFTVLRVCVDRHIVKIDRHTRAVCDELASSVAHIRSIEAASVLAEQAAQIDEGADGGATVPVLDGEGAELVELEGAEGE